MNRKTADVLVPAALLLVCIAAFLGYFIRPGLVDRGRDSLPPAFDFQSYFMPRFVLGSKELFAGRLPIWNRFEYGGIPLLATAQPAALYPPKVILFGLFPPVTALWLYFAVHYVALAGTFLWFLQKRGVTGIAAFAGTAVWVFSPPLLLSSYNPVRIANMVWMPLLFTLSESVAERKTWKAFAGLALVVALQLVAGYPEATIDIALLLVVHAVAMYVGKHWKDPPWITLPRIGAAFALGGLAAAAQMLPLAELASIAQRKSVVTALQPNFDLFAALLSTVPALVVLVFIGMFLKRARPALAGFFTCALMGEGGWLILRRLPGFSMSRFPYVWVFLWVFYFGWFAAEGMRALLEDEHQGRRARVVALAATIAGGVVTAIGFAVAWSDGTPLAGRTAPLLRYANSAPSGAFGILGGLLLAAAGALTLRRREAPADARLPWLWGAAVLALVMSHLAGFPYGNVPSPFGKPKRHGDVAMLHGDPRRIQGRALSLEDMLYGYEISDALPSPLGVEFSFIPFRYRQLLLRLKFLPVYGTIDWNALLDARGLLNAMDVELISAQARAARFFADHGFSPVRRSGDLMLFDNPERMGHAWVSYGVHREASEDGALDYVLGNRFDPRRATLLEGDTTFRFPEDATEPPTSPRAERRYSPTDVEFDVQLEKPGIFVHSESAYPGWEVTVDDRAAKLLVGNYVMRAVELTPGRHTVRFEYRPPSVRYGLMGSALGLAAITGLFVLGRKRRAPLAAPPIS
jgi:hypothetical protein